MTDLCTLTDVKDWLATGQQPFPPTDDALLARLITACSVFIESWLSRPLGLANWQEIRQGSGGGRMQLWATPITNVLSLQINGVNIPAAPPLARSFGTSSLATGGLPTEPITFNPANAVLPPGYFFTPTDIYLSGWNFARHSQVIVLYTAGYSPIPADLQQACIEAVVRKYRERTRIAEHSRSLGGAETVAYSTVMFGRRDFATDIDVLLWQYRQVSPLLRATLIGTLPEQFVLEDGATVMDLEDGVTPIVTEGGGPNAGAILVSVPPGVAPPISAPGQVLVTESGEILVSESGQILTPE